MSTSAHVESLELLQRLHVALARFGADAQQALAAANLELRRVENALEERLKHWLLQVNKRQEDVNRARSELVFARAMHKGKTTGCVEQELALRKAQERLREAEAKVVVTRRWIREVPNLVKDYEGPARALSGYVEADLRMAVAQLESRIAAIEGYVAIPTPDVPQSEPNP
jgi:hypothetical protein